MSHPAQVDSLKSRCRAVTVTEYRLAVTDGQLESQHYVHHRKLPIALLIALWMQLASDRQATGPRLAKLRESDLRCSNSTYIDVEHAL